MDLTNIFGALTGNDAIDAISDNLKIDSKQVSSVINQALPTLLGAMQKNAGTAAGAAALTQALGNHAGQGFNLNLEDGKKILEKVFGGNLGSVISSIGQKTSTSNDQVNNILASVAPNLLSVLGKGAGSGNIGNILGGLLGGASNSNSGSNAGKVIGGLLGKMFKK